MNVKEATVAALRKRYANVTAPPVLQLKSPVSSTVGQRSRLGQLNELLGGDRKKVAEAIGVPRDTVTRWINGKRGISKASQAKLERAYQDKIVRPKQDRANEKARKAAARTQPPRQDAKVRVTAVIRWTNSDKKKYNVANPHRSTTLDHIDLRPVAKAWTSGRDPGRALERAISRQYKVTDGIFLEGDDVTVEFLD